MNNGYNLLLKLSIFLSVVVTGMIISGFNAYAAPQRPVDNDEAYKLPMFVPKVALPKNSGKVIFNDKKLDNDEMYSMPKTVKAAPAPTAAAPTATAAAAIQAPSQPPDKAAKDYQQQYEEYQERLAIYNRQMEEYAKQTGAQAAQPAVSDNDTSYILPGQYSPVKKTVQPVYKPQQQYKAPAQQYNQQYNYSDQYDRGAPAAHPVKENQIMPNYYN